MLNVITSRLMTSPSSAGLCAAPDADPVAAESAATARSTRVRVTAELPPMGGRVAHRKLPGRIATISRRPPECQDFVHDEALTQPDLQGIAADHVAPEGHAGEAETGR